MSKYLDLARELKISVEFTITVGAIGRGPKGTGKKIETARNIGDGEESEPSKLQHYQDRLEY